MRARENPSLETAMSRRISTHVAAREIPPSLREGIADDETVTVVVIPEAQGTDTTAEVADHQAPLSVEDIFALRQPPFRSTEDIEAGIREGRDDHR